MGPILDDKTWSNIDNRNRYSRRKKNIYKSSETQGKEKLIYAK